MASGLPPFALAVTLLIAQAPPASAQPGPPCAACLGVVISPEQADLLPAALNGLEVLVRDDGTARVAEALDRIGGSGGASGLWTVGPPPASAHARTLSRVNTVVADVRTPGLPISGLLFEIKTWVTGLRAIAPGKITIGIVADAEQMASLAKDAGPYVDLYILPAARPGESDNDRPGSVGHGTTAAPAPAAPTAVWRYHGVLDDVSGALARTRNEPERGVWEIPHDAEQARHVLADLARSRAVFSDSLVPTADTAIRCGPRSLDVFLNPTTLDRVAFAEMCDPRDVKTTPSNQSAEITRLHSGGVLVRVASAAPDRFAERVGVTAARGLTVEEIVARHQAAAARQNVGIDTRISSGTLVVTFEAPGFPAPVTITSEAVMYIDRDRTEIEQRDIRVNGIQFSSGNAVPRLPIIEPERVSSPPLSIALTDDYRYRLAGEEQAAGTRCYVVAFEPASRGRTLFKGRAWIAIEDFGLVKVAAVQTNLRGPIVSSEQIDEFRRDPSGRWLIARSDVHQMYEGAAHRTPIHRVLELTRHDVNDPSFVSRREEAYASHSVILRDTPRGFRYVSRGSGGPGARSAPSLSSASSRVRTLALGVLVDPNISRPLPFAGLSYVDFDLFGTGTQFNGFFGGTYGQMAFSIPSIAGSRWQLAGRAFGIAAFYNDRAFVEGREAYDRNVRQRPAQASVWIVRPLSSRISVRGAYELDYTRFASSAATAPDFQVPANQTVHGLRLAIDGQRGGWQASLWWNGAHRAGWRAWGRALSGEYSPRHAAFQRWGASVARSAVLGPTLVARGEAAAMSGDDLDRFSQYSFGTFDNRLRGFPSALIRYDRGGVLRGTIAWAPRRIVRVDGFLDAAVVHDAAFGRGLRNFTGVGAAAEAPAPFGTLVALEWGFGIQGVNPDGRRGTHVVRVSAYKIF